MSRSANFARLRLPAARDLIAQGSSSYVASLLLFVRALALAVLLTPEQLGIIASISLLASLAQFADLGAGAAMEQRIPELGHREEEVRKVQQTGFLARLGGALLFSIGVCVWLVFGGSPSDEVIVGMLTAILLFPTQALQFAQQSYLRATRNFKTLAKVTIAYSTANLGASVAAGLLFGFIGIVLAQLTVTALTVVYASRRGIPLRPGWAGAATARQLVRLGWPLTLLTISQYILINIDQVLASLWFGQAGIGAYSLVIGFGMMLYFVPMSVTAVAAPRLLRAYAEKQSAAVLIHYGWRPVVALRTFMPALIGMSWVAVWILFSTALQEYSALALEASLVHLMAIYFLGVNLGPNAALIAVRKHQWNVPIIAVSLITKFVSDWVLVVLLDGGLVSFAWGSVAGFSIYLVLHIGLVSRQLRIPMARACAYAVWPGAFMLAAAVWALRHWDAQSFLPCLAVAAIGSALSAALWLPNRSFQPALFERNSREGPF